MDIIRFLHLSTPKAHRVPLTLGFVIAIAITKDSVKFLYKLAVPDVVFLENTGDSKILQKIEEY